MSQTTRLTLDLTGILQGVGFRPTLARLVAAKHLTGWVRNQSGSVRLVLYGDQQTLEQFVAELPAVLPPQARLETLREISRELIKADEADETFMILDSQTSGKVRISIPADLVTCENCLQDIFNPSSRFHGYPFTTCTNCGPRYTVVDGMPYDRVNTAMRPFALCPECWVEYNDPFNRRFHAETIACHSCGPRLSLVSEELPIDTARPIAEARRLLSEGRILAVKGLGGFLLAVDATNMDAVMRLRKRKHRPDKPFAVMARSVAAVEQYCLSTDTAIRTLSSSRGPVVIMDVRPELRGSALMSALSPDVDTLGVMLPTTPLHHFLADPLPGDPVPAFALLVMTSGNRGGEPICLTAEEAFERLGGIADAFLIHNRDIHLRNDDSLVIDNRGSVQVWRRARGYAPRSLPLTRPLRKVYLAMGAHLKNAIALGFGKEVVLSPHVGDLETPEALDAFEQVVERLPRFFEKLPGAVLTDLHPDMPSSRVGRELAVRLGVPTIRVQHHHAHAAAVMSEFGLEDALALVFDGTGLGSDGAIWGGELLHVYPGAFKRLGTFSGVPLPGGDAAIRHPARQLIARWVACGRTPEPEWCARLGISEMELETWVAQCRKRINCPSTHAVGRLFDSWAAALGLIAGEVSYDGQAAVRLETAARRSGMDSFREVPFAVKETADFIEVDFGEAFRMVSSEVSAEDVGRYAAGFHRAVADAAVQMAEFGREMTNCSKVVMSGGVMMNRVLCQVLFTEMKLRGFHVYEAFLAPPNDGGIALGQIYAAGEKN